ncbi:methyl-accepting chemotaxis protein [Thetidibacter halocola]|uniref:Methyl-accepting chemotaxis protein n=1 Tax=Thetidibacter halocola TaxID=2827239 RepID=A0A8J8B6W7_9RHOB|nr:methyl-accepting chemotaxis protein [Thetidibacter halocola]MBS0122970.1 methyl-accepting chemotaxis protein [Thetidibacter halocola]
MRPEPEFPVPDHSGTLTALTRNASGLGREVVEVSAFLTDLDRQCHDQSAALGDVARHRARLDSAVDHMQQAVARMATQSAEAVDRMRDSSAVLAESGHASRGLAEWVNGVHAQGETVQQMVMAIRNSNIQISDIASQVSILAVNAKIEAARAGQAGKGFSIVADAVNELSQKTARAAESVSGTVSHLSDWLNGLQAGAARNARIADGILSNATRTDAALNELQARIGKVGADAQGLSESAAEARGAAEGLRPVLSGMDRFVTEVTHGVDEAARRCLTLVDTSEEILQQTVELGGDGADSPMITLVQDLAGQIVLAFEDAIARGRITPSQLFDTTYRPIPGSDPQQVRTAFTDLTDALLPPIQEPVLHRDPRVVFCAAVDRNGFLPTHNRKFSQPQGNDPVWNAANCRNRRIFDDRVGLKAGRNERPFLLQVYRRDMGGGTFVMMKDLSAPIRVQGRHWGGLRLAYRL